MVTRVLVDLRHIRKPHSPSLILDKFASPKKGFFYSICTLTSLSTWLTPVLASRFQSHVTFFVRKSLINNTYVTALSSLLWRVGYTSSIITIASTTITTTATESNNLSSDTELNPHTTLWHLTLFSFPLDRWENWSSERLNDLPKVAELTTGRAGIQIEVYGCTSHHFSLCHYHMT